MSDKKLAIKLSTLEGIGNAIREKDGSTDAIPVNTLADRIAAIPSASGGVSKFAQYAGETLEEITADDLRGITSIKYSICRGYKTLKSVEIGDNITSIGQYAFADCPNLATVTMNVPPRANILNYVFSYNSPITRVNIDNLAIWCDVGLLASSSSPAIAQVATVYIKNSLGVYEPAINIEIPNTVTIVRHYVFYHWKDMSSVIIPNSVTNIQTEAFNKCESLTSVTIGNGVTKIGSKAFNCGGTDIKTTFTFLGTTPSEIYNNTFVADWIEKIIVPKGCGEAYKTATNWANFADYIEEAAE